MAKNGSSNAAFQSKWMLCGVAIIGLVVGLGIRHFFAPADTQTLSSEDASVRAESEPGESITNQIASLRNAFSNRTSSSGHLRSTDTLEDLKNLDMETLYGRLAHWLMDASEEDIAAYWEHYLTLETKHRDITDLVMIGWTRVNPEAATAAVEGTGNEQYAWWAWTSHDPDRALEVAIETSSRKVHWVAWGLGEFHPQWLREHLDDIPEAARSRALQGMSKWGETDDAMASVKFLKEHGRTPPKGMMRSLVRQDPVAAFKLYEEDNSAYGPSYGSSTAAFQRLAESLAEEHPDVLERFIAEEPSGKRKEILETAAFKGLLKDDPGAAYVMAQSMTPGPDRTKRLETVALDVIRQNPERAFEIAKGFVENPEHLISTDPEGVQTQMGNKLFESLMARDPARLMEMGLQAEGDSLSESPLLSNLSSKWVSRDVVGYAEWLVDQGKPEMTAQAAPTIIRQLRKEYRYEEAMEWASGTGSHDSRRILRQWNELEPGRAQTWLEQADLPENERETLQTILEQSR